MSKSPHLNPAFRVRAFVAYVAEGIWPGTASRLARSYYRHGKRVSYSRIGTDDWQHGMWPMSEDEVAELKALAGLTPENDLPF